MKSQVTSHKAQGRFFCFLFSAFCLLFSVFCPLSSVTYSLDTSVERISLDLKGIEINELFRLLSQKMGVTIVPSKSVSGRLNIYLNNLTFDDALDVVLISQDLACERQDKIINIMTGSEYEKLYGRKYNEKRKFKNIKLNYAKPATVFNALAQMKSDIGKVIVDENTATLFLMDTPERLEIMAETVKDLDRPPSTEVFDLQYAKAEDIKTHLASVITPGPGELIVDSRSTKVVVSDLPDKMEKIKRIIKAFDSENPQVLIETKIVEITMKDEFQHDINWERILNNIQKYISQFSAAGTFPVAPSFSVSPALSADSLAVSIGTLETDDFTSAFRVLETLGNTRIISEPRIVATNNQEAKILVGSREAYVIQSLSQATASTVSAENIEFIDVGVKLNVVPTIHKDGFITMRIKPEVSSVRETITTTLGSRIPIVETAEVETTVKVKENSMIMIAGMYKEDKRDDKTGVPGISRIPFLGAAFGSRATLKKRTEVVVFLIPRLIKGDVNSTDKDMEGWMSKKLLPEVPGSKEAEVSIAPLEPPRLQEIPASAVEPALNNSSINIQQKLKGLKEY